MKPAITYEQYKNYLITRRRGDWFFAYLIKMVFFPFAILVTIATIAQMLGMFQTHANEITFVATFSVVISAFTITKYYFFNTHRKYNGDKYQVMQDIIEEETITNKFNGKGGNESIDDYDVDDLDVTDIDNFMNIDNIHNEEW